jgi:hypothetical protein
MNERNRGYKNAINDMIVGLDRMEIDYMDIDDSRNNIRPNNSNYGQTTPLNNIAPDLYSSNVAAMLASAKNFGDSFLDVLEDIFAKNGTAITEEVLNSDMLRILAMNCENDCYLTTMKFDVFIHLMHIEECLRVMTPLIDDKKFVELQNANRGQMIMEFELDRPIVLNNPCVFFCEKNVLQGCGTFYTYEGRASVSSDRLSILFKFIRDQELDSNAKYVVFEKPYESGFDAWQTMIRVFRNNQTISQKFFGPFEFDRQNTLKSFLDKRDSTRDLMLAEESGRFNGEQRDAIFSMAVQNPRNSFILFGPPGTGKTTTLVEAIRVIRKTYKPLSPGEPDAPRFLVCTPSNSAADSFAITLLENEVLPTNLIFRAIASRYEPESYDPRLNDIVKKRGDSFCMPDTKEDLLQYHVIISTIGFCHAMKALGKKFFTHIFVDEAGQCMEAETYIPMAYYGREQTRMILAGDPQQLGPVITSNFLCNPAYGGHISCLLRLAELEDFKKDPRLMVQLRNNHRSHEYIVDLVSHMFYSNTLRFTRPPGHDSLCSSHILGGSKIPVRFVCVYGKEVETAPSFYNPEEMEIVDYYVKRCLSSNHGLKPADVGVVCPYRESVRRMQLHFQNYRGMTVDTVERFQGSERRVIIMTTIRTAAIGFLQEYRRFNTAITRAKHMLIVIGDARLLIQDPVWKEFLYYLNYSKCFDPNTDDPELLEWWNRFFASLDGH